MIHKSRSYRRHQLARAKAWATWYCRTFKDTPRSRMTDDERTRWIGIATQTRKPCSGHCCGNPRRWFGERTVQERRQAPRRAYDAQDQEV